MKITNKSVDKNGILLMKNKSFKKKPSAKTYMERLRAEARKARQQGAK